MTTTEHRKLILTPASEIRSRAPRFDPGDADRVMQISYLLRNITDGHKPSISTLDDARTTLRRVAAAVRHARPPGPEEVSSPDNN